MMVHGLRPLLLGLTAAVAAVGAATPAHAATGAGTVIGHVVDSAGHAVPGFALRLVTGGPDPDDGDPLHSYPTRTDASGAFTVEGVAPARYTLLDDEPGWFETAHGWAPVVVSSDATATPTVVALKAATVSGRVVSSADGTPIAGQTVYGGGPTATTDSAGAFTIELHPGRATIRAGSRYWFDAGRTSVHAEGSVSDLGTIGLDPAGIVRTTLVTSGGRRIGAAYQSAVVDGCRVANGHPSTCVGVDTWAQVDSLQLTAGRHSVRYEVRSPVTSTVRHVTRSIDVTAGTETTVPDVVFATADPARRTVVEKSTYRRGRAVVVRVDEGSWVDGASPRLPVSLRVDGRPVTPTSTRWTVRRNGVHVLTATLPKALAERAVLKVRAIVHGRGAYSGQVSATTTSVRSR